MQPASLEVSAASLLAPALLAGAIVLSFFACHYRTERKNRRDLLRWCEDNRPKGSAAVPPDPSKPSPAAEASDARDSFGAFLVCHGRG